MWNGGGESGSYWGGERNYITTFEKKKVQLVKNFYFLYIELYKDYNDDIVLVTGWL